MSVNDLQSVMEDMRIHESEIARYDAMIVLAQGEVRELKKMREEQMDSLRMLARGEQKLPLTVDENTGEIA